MNATPASQQVNKLPFGTYILVLAQAINLTAAVIAVSVAALVGIKLSPSPAWATLPYGVQFATVMLLTYPAAILMRKYGRRSTFMLGAMLLIIAGLIGFYAVERTSFNLLILAHACLGAYIASANFYRFAAVDHLLGALKARGISMVVAGGVLAAFIGPALAIVSRSGFGAAEFSLSYGVFTVLGLLVLVLMSFWRPLTPIAENNGAEKKIISSTANPSTSYLPAIIAAMIAAAGGYFVMTLLMVQASLVMRDICTFDASSYAIQAHVLAMFAPSFFTGIWVTRFGAKTIILLGFILLIIASALGVVVEGYAAIFSALVFLGLGWNFTYVAGGALLAQHVADAERHRWQGLNDTAIAACATLGALMPAPILHWIGWFGSNLVSVSFCVLCALGCVLCLRGLRNASKIKIAVEEAVSAVE